MPMDTGSPISYEVLEKGTPVFSSDGQQIGKVEHVLAAEAQDIFEGLVITELSAEHFPAGHHHRFVDALSIGGIFEGAVMLKLDAAACGGLPEPTANPAVMRENPADAGSSSGSMLRRAWDRISGNY